MDRSATSIRWRRRSVSSTACGQRQGRNYDLDTGQNARIMPRKTPDLDDG
jgi:hypothetical protein